MSEIIDNKKLANKLFKINYKLEQNILNIDMNDKIGTYNEYITLKVGLEFNDRSNKIFWYRQANNIETELKGQHKCCLKIGPISEKDYGIYHCKLFYGPFLQLFTRSKFVSLSPAQITNKIRQMNKQRILQKGIRLNNNRNIRDSSSLRIVDRYLKNDYKNLSNIDISKRENQFDQPSYSIKIKNNFENSKNLSISQDNLIIPPIIEIEPSESCTSFTPDNFHSVYSSNESLIQSNFQTGKTHSRHPNQSLHATNYTTTYSSENGDDNESLNSYTNADSESDYEMGPSNAKMFIGTKVMHIPRHHSKNKNELLQDVRKSLRSSSSSLNLYGSNSNLHSDLRRVQSANIWDRSKNPHDLLNQRLIGYGLKIPGLAEENQRTPDLKIMTTTKNSNLKLYKNEKQLLVLSKQQPSSLENKFPNSTENKTTNEKSEKPTIYENSKSESPKKQKMKIQTKTAICLPPHLRAKSPQDFYRAVSRKIRRDSEKLQEIRNEYINFMETNYQKNVYKMGYKTQKVADKIYMPNRKPVHPLVIVKNRKFTKGGLKGHANTPQDDGIETDFSFEDKDINHNIANELAGELQVIANRKNYHRIYYPYF